MRQIFPAVLIGVALGFASLVLRELGYLVAAAATILLGLYYALQHRYAAFGWLLIGGAASWIALLGPVAVGSIFDPHGAATVPETWVGLTAAIVLAGCAVALLILAGRFGAKHPS
jgi:hypothetical protein